MATYRELTYMVIDELKMISDDSHFQPEHIIFLLDKYRATILVAKYKDIRKEIPESNYQTICLDLESVEAFEDDICGGSYRRSIQEIPYLMPLEDPKVSTTDFFTGTLTYVNRERFKYVGTNKYLKNIIYTTIAPNRHLYLKSANIQYKYLEKIRFTGIFEDSVKASELQCEGEEVCDLMDRNFPIEEDFIPTLIGYVVSELSKSVQLPADEGNNAGDDMNQGTAQTTTR